VAPLNTSKGFVQRNAEIVRDLCSDFSIHQTAQGLLGLGRIQFNGLIDALRNLLVHRIVPGRSIQLSNSREIPHGIDLDQWWEGDMTRIYGGCGFPEPKRVFDLDANCLVRERDWVDNTIDGLAKQLTELALASL
jgi:hypothetical protein